MPLADLVISKNLNDKQQKLHCNSSSPEPRSYDKALDTTRSVRPVSDISEGVLHVKHLRKDLNVRSSDESQNASVALVTTKS